MFNKRLHALLIAFLYGFFSLRLYNCWLLVPHNFNLFFIYISHYNDLWTLTIYILQYGEHKFRSWNRLITSTKRTYFYKIKKIQHKLSEKPSRVEILTSQSESLDSRPEIKSKLLETFLSQFFNSFLNETEQKKKWKLKTFKINFLRDSKVKNFFHLLSIQP